MNKWYRSAPCKGVLLVLEHLMASTAAVCLVWMMTCYMNGGMAAILDKPEQKYEDSKVFEEQLQGVASDIIWAEPRMEEFETEGIYDENKTVDLREFLDDETISGENKSGLAYRLGDLYEWGITGVYGNYGATADIDKKIIVCKREDGTYQYFYQDEFQKMLEDGSLRFSTIEEAKSFGYETQEEIFGLLLNGEVGYESLYKNLLDSDGRIAFTSFWLYDGYMVEETYKPLGVSNLVELVNTDPRWNGKLSEVMEAIAEAVDQINNEVDNCRTILNEWSEGNSNLYYLLVDRKTGKIYSNRAEILRMSDWKEGIEYIKKYGKYVVVTPKLAEFESNMKKSATVWKSVISSFVRTNDYVCAFAVDTTYPVQDQFYQENEVYSEYAPVYRTVFGIGITAVIIFLICLTWLTIISGRSNREEGVCLLTIDRMKTEIFIVIVGGACALAVTAVAYVCDSIFSQGYYHYTTSTTTSSTSYAISNGYILWTWDSVILLGMAFMLLCAAVSILWFGMTRRIKAHTIWKNSLFCWICRFIKMMFSNINALWGTLVGFGVFTLLHWFAVGWAWQAPFWLIVMLAAEAVALVVVVRSTLGRNRIRKGVSAIAEGQVDYQIPLEGLSGEQRGVAEQINKIGDGLDRALEASMKNERMKTDLITNVSHDIKTPLTSIINYVELLKRENFEDPKIQNYLQILEEKAFRLKTLTEDVVEASKVSSGNIKLEKMNLNLVELVNQTYAELEEKFTDRNLHLVVNLPEEPAIIFADGRRMWRVLFNVFNNAAKYAMEGTRVYVDLMTVGQEIRFTLKNVSEQPLNISADELTERFIRGDLSRSTEGSGLGLSIAKNLTELQGGTFELYLDGDLFKVLICFPKAE